jgi:hypothetical protein
MSSVGEIGEGRSPAGVRSNPDPTGSQGPRPEGALDAGQRILPRSAASNSLEAATQPKEDCALDDESEVTVDLGLKAGYRFLVDVNRPGVEHFKAWGLCKTTASRCSGVSKAIAFFRRSPSSSATATASGSTVRRGEQHPSRFRSDDRLRTHATTSGLGWPITVLLRVLRLLRLRRRDWSLREIAEDTGLPSGTVKPY